MTALAALIAGLGVAPSADACGGCVAASGGLARIVQQSERVFFHRDEKTRTTTVWVEVRYSGPAKDFGWIVPLPKKPKVGVGTSYLFDRLDQAAAPRFHTRIAADNENCSFDNGGFGDGFGCGGGFAEDMAMQEDTGAGPYGGSSSFDGRVAVEGVDMVDVGQVGPYAYAVLAATTSKSLYAWLDANKYVMPAGGKPIVESHVANGDVFVAVRLKNGVGIDRIRPIVFKLHDVDACVPLRLTSIAAVDDMLVTVYLAGPGRAVPKNMMHVHVNPMRLSWNNAAVNYANVLSEAIDEAAGRAFVTEYSQPTNKLRVYQPVIGLGEPANVLFQQPVANSGEWGPGPIARPDAIHVQHLEAVGTLGQLANTLLVTQLPIVADTAAILEQFTEGAAADAGQNPVAYYRGLRSNTGSTKLGVTAARSVNGKALAKALQAYFVEPLQEAVYAINASDRLTRLSMRISPSEMDRDPLFAFNPSLPQVDNVHEATVNNACGPDASTISGTRYVIHDLDRSYVIRNGVIGVSPNACNPLAALPALDKRFTTAPSASRIEVLDESGAPAQVHAKEVELVDALIAGSRPGLPTVPKNAVLKQAGFRWDPPPSDPPEGIQEAAAEVTELGPGCLSTTTGPRYITFWLLLLAVLALLARRRAT